MSMEKQHRALATSLRAGYGEGGSLAGHSFWGKVTSTWKHSILVLSPHLWKKDRPKGISKVWVSWALSEGSRAFQATARLWILSVGLRNTRKTPKAPRRWRNGTWRNGTWRAV